MAWQKGQSGNPRGRVAEKLFTDQLRIAVNVEDVPGTKRLRTIAEKLALAAVAGEAWAIQQVADRLDGKPAQESSLVIDDKRERTDWTRDELVAFLNDARASGGTAPKAEGLSGEPDSVH
jgi:CO/xanthine dehydrogenase FAD-binding subunit